MKLKFLAALAMALVGFQAQAVLITTAGDPSTGTATITIAQPIEFTVLNIPAVNGIPNHANISFVINEAAYPNDGSKTDVSVSGLTFTINGGTPMPVEVWRDNLAASAGDVTPNDVQLYNTGDAPFSFTPGDKIVLQPGTLTMNSSATNFNLFPTGDYTMFVSAQSGYQITGAGSVIPEPASVTLLGAGAFGIVFLRRRFRR